jgi:hypothetical protein
MKQSICLGERPVRVLRDSRIDCVQFLAFRNECLCVKRIVAGVQKEQP